MLYDIVSSVLYHTPVVQDMRMFLQGIQNTQKRHDVPCFKRIRLHHKLELLGNIRKSTSSTRPLVTQNVIYT